MGASNSEVGSRGYEDVEERKQRSREAEQDEAFR